MWGNRLGAGILSSLGLAKIFGQGLPKDPDKDARTAEGAAYDRTRRAEPDIADRLARHLNLEAGSRVLDLACGTGNYAQPLAERGFQVVGLDRSAAMLGEADTKVPEGRFTRGEATALPFADTAFDGAICVSALHTLEDPQAALQEVARCLKDGGRLVVFMALRHQMRGYWLNHYFPETMERAIAAVPDQDRLEAAFEAAGFDLEVAEPWEVPERPLDLFLYAGKSLPGLYLNGRIRSGMTAFARLAAPKETVAGVRKLSGDIGSAEIKRIAGEYSHDLGDYSFLKATKRTQK